MNLVRVQDGISRVEMLALLTLAMIVVVLLGRAVIIHLRPVVDEEHTREQLEEEVKHTLDYIGGVAREATAVEIAEDNTVLRCWLSALDAEREPYYRAEEMISFHVTEDGELVEMRGDHPRVLSRIVQSIEFYPVDEACIGVALRAQANAEILDVRDRVFVRGFLSP